jgi:hypothetical protein
MTNTIDAAQVESEKLEAPDTEITGKTKKIKLTRKVIYSNAFLVFALVGLVLSILHTLNIILSARNIVDEVAKNSIIMNVFPLDVLNASISLVVTFLFVIFISYLIMNSDSSVNDLLGGLAIIITIVVGGLSLLLAAFTFSVAFFSLDSYTSLPKKESNALLESTLGTGYGLVNFDLKTESESKPKADEVTYVSSNGEFYKFDKLVDGNTITWTLEKTNR